MKKHSAFPFGALNYKIMIAGIVVLILGFLIIAADGEPHGFGFLGLTLGPIVVLSGFAIEIVAIVIKDKSSEN
jgi:hypothetical protein